MSLLRNVGLIEEQVDIYVSPTADGHVSDEAGAEITLGDLHGNMIKLLFTLVKYGIATNLSAKDYSKIVGIYSLSVDQLEQSHLCEFNEIIDRMTFRTGTLIRLIGDELADRGSNDYFTLKLLDQLQKSKVPVETLLSNHGVEFIDAYEKGAPFSATMVPYPNIDHSMMCLQRLIDRRVISREQVLEITDRGYKPTLLAISYSLNKDLSDITIYSHAGIGLNTIQALADQLGLPYLDGSAKELAQTIDAINQVFKKYVQNNTVHTLYTQDKMIEAYKCERDFVIDSPFEFIMMNRNYDAIKRPDKHLSYQINFVHGHEISDRTVDNIYNLDNDLGKSSDPKAPKNKGLYSIFYVAGQALSSSLSRPLQDDLDASAATTSITPPDLTLIGAKQTTKHEPTEKKQILSAGFFKEVTLHDMARLDREYSDRREPTLNPKNNQ